MRGHLAYAEGSPCPTLVLPVTVLPKDEAGFLPTLATVRRKMCESGLEHVLKIAVVGESLVPGYDLDYLFVQCLPGYTPKFDLRGSCGHSILSSVLVAARAGWIGQLRPGSRIRVRVRNNDDTVTCWVDQLRPQHASFTVQFTQPRPILLADLLLLGEPVVTLHHSGGTIHVSMVAAGNPYVYVDGIDLGCGTPEQLFAADHLVETLCSIRQAAECRLSWPPGAFPKIAVVCTGQDGETAVRALSMPSWHPSLALTGAVCLAAASSIEGTIPARRVGGQSRGELRVRTVSGTTVVRSAVSDGVLRWVRVSPKVVTALGDVDLTAPRSLRGQTASTHVPVAR